MSLVIAHNISALTAQHNLTSSSRSLTRSIEKLSSGLKVNRGADGPAALVISEKQRAQIAGLNKAIENSEKGISLVQTAEGEALNIRAPQQAGLVAAGVGEGTRMAIQLPMARGEGPAADTAAAGVVAVVVGVGR